MKKIDLFNEVVRIMAEDSSTMKDIKGTDPEQFRGNISEAMPEEDFYYLVRSYLASFGVISHVSFNKKQSHWPLLRLRKTGNHLYVLAAEAGSNLSKGDEIVVIDDITIADFYQGHQEFFVSSTEERQALDWGYFVRVAKTLSVKRQGKILETTFNSSTAIVPKEAFESKWLNQDTFYMRLDNFFMEKEISELYASCQEALSETQNLIIDVRTNQGGADSLYFPLFEYTLPPEQGFKDIDSFDDYHMEILYTPFNVQARLSDFQEQLENPDISAESRQMIAEFIQELEANADKGYVEYPGDLSEFLPEVKGKKESPQQIYILTDVYCGSSGESFVEIMKLMPKVTVLGRPTLGILDYSNCCSVDFGDYTLTYPTSRSQSLDAGKGMTDKGVVPDILIPWTKEHLDEDVDLKVVMEMVEKS
ncbi:S41 family peptidase [Streptococcus hongkongensis]|nr:peptidase S41 [Streptococcus uberis]